MNNNFLSNIELYYSTPENFKGGFVVLRGDDFHHITRVMRHTIGDEIYVTNGNGEIFKGKLNAISKSEAISSLEDKFTYDNKLGNITFCLPKLKSSDRFEFALEKSVELGITNFIIFDSARSVVKGAKSDRWNKIALAAMKQSLRSFLPVINEVKSFTELPGMNGEIIILEQNSKNKLSDLEIDSSKNYFFVFGPEGGLDEKELKLCPLDQVYSLAENRLRSETAVIKAASILAIK